MRIRSTTILAVRRNGKLAIAGDGQVTFDKTIMKHGAHKVRRIAGGAVLAGFAGGQLLLASIANGPMLNFYGFVPVALGGLGNNRGAIAGGLLLGLFQQAANFLVGGVLVSVAVFSAFIVVLMAAPQGLFGAPPTRRV